MIKFLQNSGVANMYALRSARWLLRVNVYSSMADKRTLYFLCYTDVFIHNTAMKKVKLIRLFVLSFVLLNKHG